MNHLNKQTTFFLNKFLYAKIISSCSENFLRVHDFVVSVKISIDITEGTKVNFNGKWEYCVGVGEGQMKNYTYEKQKRRKEDKIKERKKE